MAYVEGGTLDDRVAEGPVPPREVEKTLREVASALDYAHRQGVIHRDIKPGNILIDGEGHALLADFGIVKLSEGGTDLTGTGVVGTPAYMAPEQAQGLELDSRADVYSLGVVVYQLLSGEPPFTGDTTMQVLLKVMQDPPPNILDKAPHLPFELGAVMDKVLVKNPDERYETAVEFAEAFSRALHQNDSSLAAARARTPLERGSGSTMSGTPTTTFPPSNEGTVGLSTTQNATQPVIVHQGVNPWVLLGGIGIMAIALVIVVLLVTSGGDGDDQTPPTDAASVARVETNAANTAAAAAVTEEPTATETLTPTAAPTALPSFGSVSFSSGNDTIGNSVSLRAEGLQPAGAGRVYVVWLYNQADESYLNLGTLSLDGLGNGARSFEDTDGRMLPAFFNATLVTREEQGFAGDVPQGEVIYHAVVPVEVSQALTEIFVASENGLGGGSLLDGAKREADVATQHAGLASRATNAAGMHSHAEHTINILRGEFEDYNGNGRGENPGRGIGVYEFVGYMEDQLQMVIDASGVDALVAVDAEFLRVCLENTRVRSDRIVELEQELLASEDIETVVDQATESTSLAEELLAGRDLNENGQVDPFEGECGLNQIDVYGLLIASQDLAEGTITPQ